MEPMHRIIGKQLELIRHVIEVECICEKIVGYVDRHSELFVLG